MKNIKPKKSIYAKGGSLSKAEDKPQYPTIRIDHEHMPEAKEWKVGEKHHVHLHVKMVGNSQSKFQNEGEYEIHKLGTDDERHEEAENAEKDADEDKEDLEHDHDDTESRVS